MFYSVTARDDTGIRFTIKEQLTYQNAKMEVMEILNQFPRRLFNPRIKKTIKHLNPEL